MSCPRSNSGKSPLWPHCPTTRLTPPIYPKSAIGRMGNGASLARRRPTRKPELRSRNRRSKTRLLFHATPPRSARLRNGAPSYAYPAPNRHSGASRNLCASAPLRQTLPQPHPVHPLYPCHYPSPNPGLRVSRRINKPDSALRRAAPPTRAGAKTHIPHRRLAP